MRKLSPRERNLVGVLAVGAVVWLWSARGAGLLGPSGPQLSGLPPLDGEPPAVERQLLSRTPVAFDVNGRDLFKYYTPPPPPRPAPVYIQPPPPPPRPPDLVKKAPEPPRAPQPPTPRFKYIGYLGTKNNQIGVFMNGEEMMQAEIGEVLDDQFKLVEFRYEVAVFGFLDPRFKEQTTELKLEGPVAGASGRSSGRSTARR